jgi:hypothetical protein
MFPSPSEANAEINVNFIGRLTRDMSGTSYRVIATTATYPYNEIFIASYASEAERDAAFQVWKDRIDEAP